MAYTLLKNGDYVVNKATYEYMCDTMEDLEKIPGNRITTGSTAIVISDSGLRLFIADSKDNWVEITEGAVSGGGGSANYELTKAKIIAALGYAPLKEEDHTEINNKIESLEDRTDALEESVSSSSDDTETNWEILNEFTITKNASTIVFNKDDNDAEYDLNSIYVEFEMKNSTRTSSIKIFINDLVSGYITNGITSNNTKSSFKANIDGGFIFSTNTAASTSSNVTNQNLQTYGNMLKGAASKIEEISFTNSNGYNFPLNSIIRIYGKKN